MTVEFFKLNEWIDSDQVSRMNINQIICGSDKRFEETWKWIGQF